MKNKILDLINFKTLELISFILIIIWCLNPLIVCLTTKTYYNFAFYAKMMITVIGLYGYTIFIITNLKKYNGKKIKLKELIKNNIPIFLLLLLVIWAIFSIFFATDKHLALYGESYRNEGLFVYLSYVGFILLTSTITNKKYISYIFETIILSAVATVTLPLTNKYLITEIFRWGYPNIFCNSNHYGYYLLISTMLALFKFLEEKNKIKQIIFLIVYAYLNYFFIVNDTFGSYLAFIISLIVLLTYSIITKWKIKESLIVLVTCVILSFFAKDINGVNISKNNLTIFYSDIKTVINYFYQNEKHIKKGTNQKYNKKIVTTEQFIQTGTRRMELWKSALGLVKTHPLVGGGIENLNAYYLKNNISQDRPHNSIVQTAAFIGIPGAIIYLIFIFYIAITNFKNMFKNKNVLMITSFFVGMSYFISSLFGNSMYYTSPYFMIILGVLIYFSNNKKA